MAEHANLPRDSLGFKERVALAALRNRGVVLAACLGLIGVAMLAWKNIPRLEDARIESPGAMVTMPYPGAAPEDVEAQVIRTLEPVLNDLNGLNLFESTARPSVATMVLTFQDGTNMDSTVEQIRGRILSKRSDLPAEVRDPTVVKFTTAFTAQMVVAIAGYRSESVLTDAADRLKDDLLALPGVSTVQLRGERRTAVRIAFDPVRLAHHGLTTETVVARLQQNSVRIPAGTIDVGNLVTVLEVEHEAKSAAAIAKIPIGLGRDALGTARTLSLAEVADVKDQYMPMRQRFLQDGVPAVGIEVRFRNEANATVLGRNVRQTIADYQTRLPPGVTARLAYDQPEWVDRALGNFTESLLEGILLVMGVVTLGLGLRSATAVAFAVPLSIGGALLGLFFFGFALEQVSIAGLIVALGLLVDDAVVVTESIQLMRDRGLSASRSSVLGTARVFWANNVTTAVACAAFMPFFFMGADIGRFVRGLPTAVVLALATSLIVAQVVTPWVSSKILRKKSKAPGISDTEEFLKRLDVGDSEREERNLALFVLKWLYVRLVPVIVRRPFVIVGLSTILLGASLCLFPRIGLQFFPKADKPLLFVRVEMPRGTHESLTARTVNGVVKTMRRFDFVKETSAVIGAGYPPIFIGRATPWFKESQSTSPSPQSST
jgi:multidrug efflux pump subunit AcrB